MFIIQKNGKSTREWPMLKSNSTLFWFNTFFSRMNNKNFTKRGSKGARLLFLYEVSIKVLIDFIAILLTPGIFLIQIVNTNNGNMYLIRFHSKNIINCVFPKVEFLKFKIASGIHYTSQRDEINCIGFSKDLPRTHRKPIFKLIFKIVLLYI